MKIFLVDKERAVLIKMFEMADDILETCGNEVELEEYGHFDRHDLYDLACKLGIDSFY